MKKTIQIKCTRRPKRENDNGNKNYVREKKYKGNIRNKNDKKNKSNNNNSSKGKPKTVYVLGYSMVKKLNGYLPQKS